MKRRFIDAPAEDRCAWAIKLRDGSEAQCGRRKTDGDLCTQHAKMAERPFCAYCGGNDELPPDHCMDCERPDQADSSKGGAGKATAADDYQQKNDELTRLGRSVGK